MHRAFILSSICTVAALNCLAASSLAADAPESLADLRKERVKAAEQWCESFTRFADGEFDWVDQCRAACALKDARIDAAANKQERVRALTAYRDQSQGLFDKIDALSQVEAKGGEAHFYAEARVHLLEAKILLKEEEAKP